MPVTGSYRKRNDVRILMDDHDIAQLDLLVDEMAFKSRGDALRWVFREYLEK